VKHEDRQSAGSLEFLLQSGVFIVLGIFVAHWLFDNAVAGAVLGLACYLLLVLFNLVGDVVAINRELSAFRKGEDRD